MSWQDQSENFNALHISFKISPSEQPYYLFQPEKIEVEVAPAKQKGEEKQQLPFPYYTDALTGLAAHKILSFSKNLTLNSPNDALCALLWEKLEPLHSIYHRSHERLKSLLGSQSRYAALSKQFETQLKEILRECCKDKTLNFPALTELINTISFLEKKIEKPLLYNRHLILPHSTMNIIHTVYSLVYNLRALVAMDYNAHVHEVCYEGLKLDPIADYLPNIEGNVNNALLYYHWNSLNEHEPHQNPHIQESIEQGFRNFSYYGYHLVKSLPSDFFTQRQIEIIEQGLYMFQVDWLLGSPSGLLFRLKEELYALKDSYEKIFWTDLHKQTQENHSVLETECHIGPEQLKKLSEAA